MRWTIRACACSTSKWPWSGTASIRRATSQCSSQQAVDLIRAAARAEVQILFDVLHVPSTHGTPAELASVSPDQFAFVHMDGGPREVPTTVEALRRTAREARLFPGEDGADFAGILPRLPMNIPYAVEVTHPARAREMGAEAYARPGWLKTMACLSARRER